MVTFVVILNLLLGVACVIFILKNLVVNYKGSEDGFKNLVFAGLIVVVFICVLNGVWQGKSVNQATRYLNVTKNLDKNVILEINNTIEFGKKSISLSTMLGYGCLFGAYLVFKNIQRERSNNIGKPKKKSIWEIEVENKNSHNRV